MSGALFAICLTILAARVCRRWAAPKEVELAGHSGERVLPQGGRSGGQFVLLFVSLFRLACLPLFHLVRTNWTGICERRLLVSVAAAAAAKTRAAAVLVSAA